MRRTHRRGGCRPSPGLRLFVDGLLEVGDLTEDERRAIEAQIGVRREKKLEQVLSEAGEMISGLSALRRRGAGRQAGRAS